MLTFWRQGYVGTTMDDLVAATGASRASLYRTFGDKKAIFAAALDLYASRFDRRVSEALETGPDADAVVQSVLTASAERLAGGEAPPGCLRCNSTLELAGRDAELDALLKDINDRFERAMARITSAAATEGVLPKARIAEAASFLTAMVDGMVVMARGGSSRQVLLSLVETARRGYPLA